jgi:hypothetical protein
MVDLASDAPTRIARARACRRSARLALLVRIAPPDRATRCVHSRSHAGHFDCPRRGTGRASPAIASRCTKPARLEDGSARELTACALATPPSEFDAAVEHGSEERQAHVGASAELNAVADEIVPVVRVMDGLNRYRFMSDAELLASWESASNVRATPRNTAESKPEPGAVRPAA